MFWIMMMRFFMLYKKALLKIYKCICKDYIKSDLYHIITKTQWNQSVKQRFMQQLALQPDA